MHFFIYQFIIIYNTHVTVSIKWIFRRVKFTKNHSKTPWNDPYCFLKSHTVTENLKVPYKFRYILYILHAHVSKTFGTQLRFIFNARDILYNIKHFFKGCPATGFYQSNCSISCPDVNCQNCHIATGYSYCCKPGYQGYHCELGMKWFQ